MLSITEPMQWANTSTWGAPVHSQTVCTAAGMSCSATSSKRHGNRAVGMPALEARTRYAWIREATAGCVQRPAQRPVTWTDRIDRVLTHRLWGTLVFLALMFVVFVSIFEWARPLMGLIDAGATSRLDRYIGYYEPYATSHDALDNDDGVQQEVRNAASALAHAIGEVRSGMLSRPDRGLKPPRPK